MPTRGSEATRAEARNRIHFWPKGTNNISLQNMRFLEKGQPIELRLSDIDFCIDFDPHMNVKCECLLPSKVYYGFVYMPLK